MNGLLDAAGSGRGAKPLPGILAASDSAVTNKVVQRVGCPRIIRKEGENLAFRVRICGTSPFYEDDS